MNLGLNAREVVPEGFVLQLKGKEKLLFITVTEVQLQLASWVFLLFVELRSCCISPTLVGHSLHGVADGNTNCAHGIVISRILLGQKFC